MIQFLFPRGEIDFHGNMEQLLQAIQQVNGTLMVDQQFRCTVSYPKPKRDGLNLIIIFRRILVLNWQFRCKYEATEFGFRISYQSVPSFFEAFLLFIPFMVAFADYSRLSTQDTVHYRLLMGLLFAAVFYPVFFAIQKGCVRYFLDTFRN